MGLSRVRASCTSAEVERSIAQGHSAPGREESSEGALPERVAPWIGFALVLLMLGVYAVSNPVRLNAYNHFVWQASAWLEGEAAILYPVYPGDGLGASNDYFQDVLPVVNRDEDTAGRALIPFPPLPAVVLLPFVAAFGLTTNAQLIAAVLGALAVGVAYWLLGLLPVRPAVRVGTTIFFALGTVFWYAAMLGQTWYLAHVVAVGLSLLAVGVALAADPGAVDEDRPVAWSTPRATWSLDGQQVLAGFLLGLAATARLPVAFGLPFLFLVGGGGGWVRRGVSAAVGLAIPVGALLAYNLVSSGSLFHPGYQYLYEQEATYYPALFPYLDYHPDWAIEDPRYIPQNLALMLAGMPEFMPPCDPPAAARSLWFDEACPVLRPRADGMSVLLTSPAFLLAIPALRLYGRSRLVAGAVTAIGMIALVNLMHFSQGWVQFGYRFSNDFIPFALPLVALGIERLGGLRAIAVALIAVSIAVNLWGNVWGLALGW
jgi:hypothetical protein